MAAEDDLRLAWQASRDGNLALRDAMLSLAIAGGGPEDAPWVERCRDWLVATRADHPFARFPTIDQALCDRQLAARLRRLRTLFPPVRVRRLLDRAEVLRGAYTGRAVPLAWMVDDLLDLPAPPPRAHRLPALHGPEEGPDRADPALDLQTFYLTILLAMAILVGGVVEARGEETRAA